jgi:hypothetical protein
VTEVIEGWNDTAPELINLRERVHFSTPIHRDKYLADLRRGIRRREVPGADSGMLAAAPGRWRIGLRPNGSRCRATSRSGGGALNVSWGRGIHHGDDPIGQASVAAVLAPPVAEPEDTVDGLRGDGDEPGSGVAPLRAHRRSTQ